MSVTADLFFFFLLCFLHFCCVLLWDILILVVVQTVNGWYLIRKSCDLLLSIFLIILWDTSNGAWLWLPNTPSRLVTGQAPVTSPGISPFLPGRLVSLSDYFSRWIPQIQYSSAKKFKHDYIWIKCIWIYIVSLSQSLWSLQKHFKSLSSS